MKALLLLDDGWTAEQVAEALLIEAETLRAQRRLYAAGELEWSGWPMPATPRC